MSLEVIYVTRHGFRSNWVVDGEWGVYTNNIKSPTGLPADPALSAHGVDQARELADHLLTLDPPIGRVYSSPYYRCLQTVEPFARKAAAQAQDSNSNSPSPSPSPPDPPAPAVPRALRVRAEHGFCEWYGTAPFEQPVPAELALLDGLFPGMLDMAYAPPAVVPSRRGETLGALHDRVAAALDAVVRQCDRDGVRAALVCAHAAVVIPAGRALMGRMPDSPYDDDVGAFTCGLSVYRRGERRGGGAGGGDGGGGENGEGGEGVGATGSNSSVGEKEVGEEEKRTGRGWKAPQWKDGKGIGGGPWICERNSDCSFLSRGEERGWRFSDDESFKVKDPNSMLDAGNLGVVVEGKKESRI